MSLNLGSFNILAMLACFVGNMVLGALWYSPILFGNVWLKLIGKKAEDISKEEGNKSMMMSMIPAVFMVIFLALLINFTKSTTILDALIIGSLVSIGFIGTSALNMVIFEDRSLKLTFLNLGYSFVSLNICAIILSIWK